MSKYSTQVRNINLNSPNNYRHGCRSQRTNKSSCSRNNDDKYCLSDRHSIKVEQFIDQFNMQTYVRFKPIFIKQFTLNKQNQTQVDYINNNDISMTDNRQSIQLNDYLNCFKNKTIMYENNLYDFKKVFTSQNNQQIYDELGQEIVSRFIQGYNGTIFTYGQTGTGKTYTMFGNNENKGIIQYAVNDVLKKVPNNVMVSCSMLEIYCENMIDLLSNNQQEYVPLKIKQNRIQGLNQHTICSIKQLQQLLAVGCTLKKMRQTKLNELSSRSHVLFIIKLSNTNSKRNQNCQPTYLYLVDLAGSQNINKSHVSGKALQQTKKINLSLSCLKNTINAIVKGKPHIPFRQSKITRILKHSLLGNSFTKLIVTCSSLQASIEETIASIKFAIKSKKIKYKPHITQHKKQYINQENQNIIEKYQQKLQQIKKIIFQIQCKYRNNKNYQITQIIESLSQINTSIMQQNQIDHSESNIFKQINKQVLTQNSKLYYEQVIKHQQQIINKLKLDLIKYKKSTIIQPKRIKIKINNTKQRDNYHRSPFMSIINNSFKDQLSTKKSNQNYTNSQEYFNHTCQLYQQINVLKQSYENFQRKIFIKQIQQLSAKYNVKDINLKVQQWIKQIKKKHQYIKALEQCVQILLSINNDNKDKKNISIIFKQYLNRLKKQQLQLFQNQTLIQYKQNRQKMNCIFQIALRQINTIGTVIYILKNNNLNTTKIINNFEE